MLWLLSLQVLIYEFGLVSATLQNITIGYLTVDKTDTFVRDRQGRVISGAISYAVEKINENPDILPDYHINIIWNDTKASTLVGIQCLTEQWKLGAVAFFGFEDSCSVEARVAAAWNLPLISYFFNFYF
ncbi:hypothetical protein KUTeg_003450 [Tegillarca granosa]|uniref:Receptor ligand binding region domain-containing protein n=1 Tax=Tegillarca granosa TaxID=220873 RepID=A0ABQ9FM68_TEGGR|nr:hypothetical protein KUTeg_003450 [Tegillarca granosa]